jgi:hypothetical protein
VCREAALLRVPKRIGDAQVVLDGHRNDNFACAPLDSIERGENLVCGRLTKVKGTALKHNNKLVVHACTYAILAS